MGCTILVPRLPALQAYKTGPDARIAEGNADFAITADFETEVSRHEGQQEGQQEGPPLCPRIQSQTEHSIAFVAGTLGLDVETGEGLSQAQMRAW